MANVPPILTPDFRGRPNRVQDVDLGGRRRVGPNIRRQCARIPASRGRMPQISGADSGFPVQVWDTTALPSTGPHVQGAGPHRSRPAKVDMKPGFV